MESSLAFRDTRLLCRLTGGYVGQNPVAQGWLVDRTQSMKHYFPIPPFSTLGSDSCKSFGRLKNGLSLKFKKKKKSWGNVNLSRYNLYTDNQVSFIHKTCIYVQSCKRLPFCHQGIFPRVREKEHTKDLDKHDRFN